MCNTSNQPFSLLLFYIFVFCIYRLCLGGRMIRYRGRDIERYNGKNEATSSRPISFSLYATRASCSSMGKKSPFSLSAPAFTLSLIFHLSAVLVQPWLRAAEFKSCFSSSWRPPCLRPPPPPPRMNSEESLGRPWRTSQVEIFPLSLF